ncbi:type VII secretion-associated serine protease mycosin [Dactylosporangium matsuzakiense]|uniref:Type VII secretion-associated serine protease n=1 Tax=Dactylosporangium matsuzakiense TaxID=53360 RepID=A0A9W6NLW5_9ACTN|nr:type VII secretion-associated serine protease mycosin [Dactylosporangium matsuzakiense]UWZ46571.1 type VII secretion-associated serine protease mycosin [Dactylosporangium matsuzakiense]GLL01302.1 type VII secretion-associated serine protease [Dactylosporangium matsuzakiense]
MIRPPRFARLMLVATALALFATPAPAFADQIRDDEWHLTALRIPEAQGLSQGEGIIVAVADTGVEDKRPELAGAVLPGQGFGEGNDGDGRSDRIGHGTAMAALIAGRGLPNGDGVLGVAPKSMILPLKAITNENGLGAPATIAAGVEWAIDQGARVICIAAATDEDDHLRQTIERALRSDVVVVAGAGNRPAATSVAFPARLPGVLAVGGTDSSGAHADIAATGPEVLVAAPAVKVMSVGLGDKYRLGTGTSDATAIVAGVAALVRARFPDLSAAEVVHRITATATDKGRPGRDDEYGFGIVNPVAALTAQLPSTPPPPPETTEPPRPEADDDIAEWAAGAGAVLVGVLALVVVRRRLRG